MNFQSTNKESEIQLDGCKFEIDRDGGTASSVTITDKTGRILRIKSMYGMTFYIPEKPKMVQAFHIKGSMMSLPVNEYFRTKGDAVERAENMRKVDGTIVAVRGVEVEESVLIASEDQRAKAADEIARSEAENDPVF